MILLVAVINFAFFGWLVYRYDLFEREPWYALLSCSIFSVILTHGFSWLLADYAIDHLLWLGSLRYVGAMVAGVGEELVKLTAVLLTFAVFRKVFNDPFDGLIYGAFAGLGFALDESWLYNTIDQTSSLFNRSAHLFARFLIHTLLGSLTCAGLGFWRFRTPRWQIVFPTLTISAMALHFAYDYAVLGMSQGNPDLVPRQQAFAVLVMVCLLVLFGRTVVVGSRKSGTVHGKRNRSLLAWPFNVLFGRKRNKVK